MFIDLLCGLFFVFPPHSRAGLCLMMGLTFFWPTPWFSLFLAMLYCYSYRNNLILLGLFWASRLFLLSVAWHDHCFAFTYGLLCSFGLSFGHPWPVCFLWASSVRLLIPHSHGLFTNFIGLPQPNNLIFILGVYGPTGPFSLFYLIHYLWDAISFFPGFFEPTCLFKTHLFISWACDPLFLPLEPNGFAIYFVNSLLPLLLGFFSHKWPSTPI